MKKLRCIILFFAYFSLCTATPLLITGDEYEPYVGEKMPNNGFFYEVVKEAFKLSGYNDLKLKIDIWERALNNVKNGNDDAILCIFKTPEREKFLIFSKPIISSHQVIFKKKTDNFTYASLASLANKKVGIVKGYTYGEDFDKAKNIAKTEFDNNTELIKNLYTGKIELAIVDQYVGYYAIFNKFPLAKKELTHCPKPVLSKEMYLAVSQKNPKANEIIDAFNKGLNLLIKNGNYDKITQKYVY